MRRPEKRRLSLAQITSLSQSQMKGKSGPHISWNKEMDAALAKALIDQMKQGNKVGGQWTRHAIPAVMHELNMTLDLDLTKDNVKNRLKAWKRHYAIISDIKNQSQLMWGEGRKMVLIRSENLEAWNYYVEYILLHVVIKTNSSIIGMTLHCYVGRIRQQLKVQRILKMLKEQWELKRKMESISSLIPVVLHILQLQLWNHIH